MGNVLEHQKNTAVVTDKLEQKESNCNPRHRKRRASEQEIQEQIGKFYDI